MEKLFGIDISVHQGDFPLDVAVSEGVKFVIIKGGGARHGRKAEVWLSRYPEGDCDAVRMPLSLSADPEYGVCPSVSGGCAGAALFP